MKKIIAVLVLGVSLAFVTMGSKPVTAVSKPGTENPGWLQSWFSAWERVSRTTFNLPAEPAPLMVFFDKDYVYTTDTSVANAEWMAGPSLLGEKLSWRKAAHQGRLGLPDGQQVPVGLMSFAGPLKDRKEKSFFVMAAPDYWKEAGVESAGLGLDKMLTGVFLHEFAHTRQMEGIGKRVDAIDQAHPFAMPLTDDIVQNHFKKDSVYVRLFLAEVSAWYEAAFAKTETGVRQLGRKALGLLKRRQAHYLTGERAILKELDNLFLTMEGLGQYTAVAWLTDPRGAGFSHDIAVKGFRRKGSQWSQEEGLALFLVLNKLGKTDWANDIFGKNPRTVIALLEEALGKNKCCYP